MKVLRLNESNYPNEDYIFRKNRHAVRLKFGDTFLTFQTKLALEVKISICSANK